MEEQKIQESKIVSKKTPKVVWWIIGIIVFLVFLSLIGSLNNQSSSQSASTPQATVPPVITASSTGSIVIPAIIGEPCFDGEHSTTMLFIGTDFGVITAT